MKKNPALLLVFVFVSFTVYSADMISEFKTLRGSSTAVIKAVKFDIPNKTAFVMLNPDYPVTPGDTYQVSYLYNLKQRSLPFFIEGDDSADLSFFGRIKTGGLTFGELKVKVENIVLKAYPNSLPRLIIKSTGSFPVLVKGEVSRPGYGIGWGFSRLSDLIANRLTKYSSLRNVEIIHKNGISQSYDLFHAALTSDLTKNPIVRPGDTIVIHPYDREVYVQGEVRRQGAFQLLKGESLEDLIQLYCDGFTKLADTTKLHIIRLNTAKGGTDTLYLSGTAGHLASFQLEDMDLVVVPSKIRNLPVVFFEGALGMKPGTSSPVSARIPWPITKGQHISTALAGLPKGTITPVSDLERAFIIRKNTSEFIPVNLEKIVYEHDYSDDPALQAGDRIVIPLRLFSVYVGGAVSSPGAVPYVAGKTYLEYVTMAGGFNNEEHAGDLVYIVDRDGHSHGKDRIIQPEDRIFAPKNSPIYIFNNTIGPIVTTTAAVISLTLTLKGLFSK